MQPLHPKSVFPRFLVVSIATVVFSACASRQPRPEEPPAATLPPASEPRETVYEFEPMVIRAIEGEGDEIETAASDIPELFREANDYLREENCAKATELFALVRQYATDERYTRAATYNLGLCRERLGQLDAAADAFDEVATRWPATEDGKDAVFRLAEVFAQQGEYQLVAPLLQRVIGRRDMTVRDTLEAHLRIGFAKLEMRDFAGAEQALMQVIQTNRFARVAWNPESDSDTRKPVPPDHWIIAQAYFGIGRIYHELFGEIRMVLPLDRYAEDLEDKHRLLNQALDSYVQAIKTGNPYWAPAAGFMSGQLYEDYYFDILASEVPAQFGPQENAIYFEELREYLRPALQRAINVYQNNLAMAYRLGSDEVWIDATLKRIEYLTDYLEKKPDWHQEEALVVAGEHPRSAHALEHMRFRDEVIDEAP